MLDLKTKDRERKGEKRETEGGRERGEWGGRRREEERG